MRFLNQFIGRFLGIVFTPFARIWSFMRRVIPGLKKLPALKPETLAALLSFIFVFTVVLVHFLIVFVFSKPDESKPSYFGTAWILIVLMFVIPVFVYLFVKILLAPPKSPFPDIDIAFEAGLHALQKSGISIKSTPLYLVLGMADSRKIKHIMAASNRTFDFSHVTADGQALYWYGSSDATYLFLSGVGNICQLTKDLGAYINQTSSSADEYAGGDFKGTIDVRALGNKGKSDSPSIDDSDISSSESLTRTIKAGELRRPSEQPAIRQQPDDRGAVEKNKTQLSSREKLSEQKQRITHLCTLLQRNRRPVCSLNGVVVAIVNRLIEEFPGQLARQTKSDLTTICETTGVISSVTAIVTGFESDEGCREFVMRLKEIHGDDFSKRRFGKSYRSWECPSPDQLREIADESIENFDQYIYSIFTQHDALSARHVNGNREMVKFLCWIYARFFEGLEITLMNGLGSEGGGDDDFPRFAGCYFMGVGETPEDQFFCEGVFDRVDENQGELEWSSGVLQGEENWTLMSQLIFLLGLVAIAAVGFLMMRSGFGF